MIKKQFFSRKMSDPLYKAICFPEEIENKLRDHLGVKFGEIYANPYLKSWILRVYCKKRQNKCVHSYEIHETNVRLISETYCSETEAEHPNICNFFSGIDLKKLVRQLLPPESNFVPGEDIDVDAIFDNIDKYGIRRPQAYLNLHLRRHFLRNPSTKYWIESQKPNYFEEKYHGVNLLTDKMLRKRIHFWKYPGDLGQDGATAEDFFFGKKKYFVECIEHWDGKIMKDGKPVGQYFNPLPAVNLPTLADIENFVRKYPDTTICELRDYFMQRGPEDMIMRNKIVAYNIHPEFAKLLRIFMAKDDVVLREDTLACVISDKTQYSGKRRFSPLVMSINPNQGNTIGCKYIKSPLFCFDFFLFCYHRKKGIFQKENTR